MGLIRKTIGIFYRHFLKPILFLFDPEKVHDSFILLGRFLGLNSFTKFLVRLAFSYQNELVLGRKIAGIYFKNPVGLSAGFDKDANLLNVIGDVGFGFMSVGTITDRPYAGNPEQRLWRLPKSNALIVYYGLKNLGVEKIAAKIKKARPGIPVFVSVGKTNSPETVSEEAGILDYYSCLKKVIAAGIGDAYEINISCPNTFGGEPFTEPGKLDRLLANFFSLPIGKPVFLKMPITLPFSEFKKLLDVILRYKVAGVIIGNLEKNYANPLLKEKIPEDAKGGISGKPCFEISNNLIAETKKYCGNKLAIIGVGGIFSAEDAREKMRLGADLVQLITGMIYEGPQLIGEINRELVK